MAELEILKEELRALTAAALCIRKRLALIRETAGLPPRRLGNVIRFARRG
jgi:hypothetical protein